MGRRAATALLAIAGLQHSAPALELTPENWEQHVPGRTVFLKFFAPWCGHCKKLAPDWSRLAADFSRSTSALVAEVDCAGRGKPLCEGHNVTGYPRLLWGRAPALQDYRGGRDYASLRRFADDSLGSGCGPGDLGLCSEGRSALLKKFMRFSPEQLDARIETAEKQLRRAEQGWRAVELNMSRQLASAEERRDEQIRRIKKRHNLLEGSSSGHQELTPDTWEGAVRGKTVFVKFFAPWCGHCKAIKNDWDRLSADYEGTATALVAEVDCAGRGKPLCEEHGVTGFPRLLWGKPPGALSMYTGARSYADFKRFAQDHLGPTCGSGDLEACDDEHRSSMETLSQMAPEQREARIRQADRDIEKVVKAFEDEHWNILLALDLAEGQKNNKTRAIQEQGLPEAKEVQAWNKKQPPGSWRKPSDGSVQKRAMALDSLWGAVWDVAGFKVPVAPLLAFGLVLAASVSGALGAVWKKPEEGEWCGMRHILTETEPEILEAKRRIDAGESFEAVAKECSKCPSGADGGSLGRRTKGNLTQPELKSVCFDPASSTGQLIGPVKTQFGFHLLVIESRGGVADPTPAAAAAKSKKEE